MAAQAYEWWNGSEWVATETYISHSDPNSCDIDNWGDRDDTYEISVSVKDEANIASAYSNVVTVNPYEWWNGSEWTHTETWLIHTDPDSYSVPAVSYDEGSVYKWTLAVQDLNGTQSDYASEFQLAVISNPVWKVRSNGVYSYGVVRTRKDGAWVGAGN